VSASPLADLPPAMALKAALFRWTIADAVAALVVAFFCVKRRYIITELFGMYHASQTVAAAYLTNINHLSPSLTVQVCQLLCMCLMQRLAIFMIEWNGSWRSRGSLYLIKVCQI